MGRGLVTLTSLASLQFWYYTHCLTEKKNLQFKQLGFRRHIESIPHVVHVPTPYQLVHHNYQS